MKEDQNDKGKGLEDLKKADGEAEEVPKEDLNLDGDGEVDGEGAEEALGKDFADKAKETLKKAAGKVTMEQVEDVLNRADEISIKFSKHSPLMKFLGALRVGLSMLKDYVTGAYRAIPFWSIAALVAAILYVLNPFDLIPDYIPVIGYLDDAVVFAIALKMIAEDFERYKSWKAKAPARAKESAE